MTTTKKIIDFFAISGFLLFHCLASTSGEHNNTIKLRAISDIQNIISKGTLVISVHATDNPPFYMVDEEGNLVGSDIDMAKTVAKAIGVKPVFIRKAKTYDEIVDMVASGECDISISKISFTPERARRVFFSHPYMILRKALIFNRLKLTKINAKIGYDTIKQMFDSGEAKINVISKSSYIVFAKNLFPKAPIEEFKDWSSSLASVVKGESLCAFRDEVEIKKHLLMNPSDNLYVSGLVLKEENDNLYIIISPQYPSLADFLNILLSNIKISGNADAILANYTDVLTKKRPAGENK